MSTKYLAGDFPAGTTASEIGAKIVLTLPAEDPGKFQWLPTTLVVNDNIADVQIITEENKQHLLPKVGWGIAGLALLGPVGALAGLILGGRGKEVCALCTLSDGRKIMILCSISAYQALQAATLQKSHGANAMASHQPNAAFGFVVLAVVGGMVIISIIALAIAAG